MAERNPKLDLKKTNVPITFILGKQFSKGETEYGTWYGYNVEFDGKPHTLFADEELHDHLSKLKTGETVTTVWEENKVGGRKSYTWNVKPAIFDDDGRVPPPTKDLLQDKEYRQTRIGDWKSLTMLSLAAAREVAEAYNLECKSEDLMLTGQDVRAMAISQMIDWTRRG